MPFKWALRRSSIFKDIELQEDIPSICAQKLKYGQVDMALVPVALLPELDSYFVETDYCIGANGKVDSVKLYSESPLETIETVILDYQSKSSVTLTKILFNFFWRKGVKFVEAKPGYETHIGQTTAAVVIGDRTFSLNGRYRYEYDLAEEWKKFTGLPFVFAAWVSIRKLEQEFLKDFNETLKTGIENTLEAVETEYAGTVYNKDQVVHYLTERIDYKLDAEKRKGLELFLNYIKQLGSIDKIQK